MESSPESDSGASSAARRESLAQTTRGCISTSTGTLKQAECWLFDQYLANAQILMSVGRRLVEQGQNEKRIGLSRP